MVPVAKNHRDKILAALKEAPFGLNSEQIAGQVGLTRYAVRPRVSELFASGLVERSDERTKNDAARSVVLWRAAREAA
jgi:predicted ArsR family transcriptional regulator